MFNWFKYVGFPHHNLWGVLSVYLFGVLFNTKYANKKDSPSKLKGKVKLIINPFTIFTKVLLNHL